MNMSRRFFTYVAFVLVVSFSFTACGLDDLDLSADPTCGRSIDFIISVSPEGAGSVTKSSYVNSEGLNGLMPFQVIQFLAILREGYRFVKWDHTPPWRIVKQTLYHWFRVTLAPLYQPYALRPFLKQ